MRHRERLLLLCGGASAVLTFAAGTADGESPARLIAPWLAAHAVYAAAAWLVLRRGAGTRLWLLLLLGFLPRLLLAPSEPRLSGDLYRYLWDGRLVADGVNPFPHAPADPALERYHDGLLGRLNHADVPTIYPPMAQLLFGATARVAAQPWAWKATLLVLDVVLVLALLALLDLRRAPRERLLLYLWNPLVVIESYGSGHVDLAVASLLLFSLALLERRRPLLGGATFAAAVLIKYMPLLLVPALLRRRAFVPLAAAAVTGAALLLPFAAAGDALGTGLVTYLRHWEFNGGLYSLLRPFFASGEPPRAILAFLLAAAAVAIGVRARTVTGAATALFAAWIVASPTVYPWYLVPLAALLPLHPQAGTIALCGLVGLSYLPLATLRAGGAWTLPPWVLMVEYGGWAAVAAAAWWRGYRRPTACATERTPT